MLEASDVLTSINQLVRLGGLSSYLVMLAAPFFVGLLTGVNQAFVTISFPLIARLMGRAGTLDIVLLTFSYVSRFVGILLRIIKN
jgi:hypothetical protein